MITDIKGPSDRAHGWRLTEFEHETVMPDGAIADLKADYGVDFLCIDSTSVRLQMSDISSNIETLLSWRGLEHLEIVATGPNVPAEDGRIGILGLRLLSCGEGSLVFEIETDWLRVGVVCRSFRVSAHFGSTL